MPKEWKRLINSCDDINCFIFFHYKNDIKIILNAEQEHYNYFEMSMHLDAAQTYNYLIKLASSHRIASHQVNSDELRAQRFFSF